MPGAGCRVPGAGCRVPGVGCRVPGARCPWLVAIARVVGRSRRCCSQGEAIRILVSLCLQIEVRHGTGAHPHKPLVSLNHLPFSHPSQQVRYQSPGSVAAVKAINGCLG